MPLRMLRLLPLVLIERFQKAVDVLLPQVIWRRQPKLRRIASATADLLRRPHPILQRQTLDGRDVRRHYRAAQLPILRRPRFRPTVHHRCQHVIADDATGGRSRSLDVQRLWYMLTADPDLAFALTGLGQIVGKLHP